MPIVAINVNMTVAPVLVQCPPPGGVFAVTVVVTGRAAGRGGSYDVEIYDQDVLIDDLLDGSYANGVLPGPFRAQHVFFLNCDSACDVVGPLGSSGESTAEIYAWANGGRNVTAMSGVVSVTCGEVPAPKDDRTSDRVRKPQRRRTAAAG